MFGLEPNRTCASRHRAQEALTIAEASSGRLCKVWKFVQTFYIDHLGDTPKRYMMIYVYHIDVSCPFPTSSYFHQAFSTSNCKDSIHMDTSWPRLLPCRGLEGLRVLSLVHSRFSTALIHFAQEKLPYLQIQGILQCYTCLQYGSHHSFFAFNILSNALWVRR